MPMMIMFQKLQLQKIWWKMKKAHRMYKQRLEEEKEEVERERRKLVDIAIAKARAEE